MTQHVVDFDSQNPLAAGEYCVPLRGTQVHCMKTCIARDVPVIQQVNQDEGTRERREGRAGAVRGQGVIPSSFASGDRTAGIGILRQALHGSSDFLGQDAANRPAFSAYGVVKRRERHTGTGSAVPRQSTCPEYYHKAAGTTSPRADTGWMILRLAMSLVSARK